MSDCVFCKIVGGTAPANVIHRAAHSLIIVPLNPVVPGHVIAIPYVHVKDAAEQPRIMAEVGYDIAAYVQHQRAYEGGGDYNIITSVGPDATQTVFHLHVHAVPREAGDGLKLPWSE